VIIVDFDIDNFLVFILLHDILRENSWAKTPFNIRNVWSLAFTPPMPAKYDT